jgi:hypothetical protein
MQKTLVENRRRQFSSVTVLPTSFFHPYRHKRPNCRLFILLFIKKFASSNPYQNVLSFSRALNKNQVDIVIVRRTWREIDEHIACRLLITALIKKTTTMKSPSKD